MNEIIPGTLFRYIGRSPVFLFDSASNSFNVILNKNDLVLFLDIKPNKLKIEYAWFLLPSRKIGGIGVKSALGTGFGFYFDKIE